MSLRGHLDRHDREHSLIGTERPAIGVYESTLQSSGSNTPNTKPHKFVL